MVAGDAALRRNMLEGVPVQPPLHPYVFAELTKDQIYEIVAGVAHRNGGDLAVVHGAAEGLAARGSVERIPS